LDRALFFHHWLPRVLHIQFRYAYVRKRKRRNFFLNLVAAEGLQVYCQNLRLPLQLC
jgi:hypothetical protein